MASDVEVGPNFFFVPKKKLAGTDVWTPYFAPINFTSVLSWTEVVLCNSVVAFQVFDTHIFWVKYRFNLAAPNIFGSKIVH